MIIDTNEVVTLKVRPTRTLQSAINAMNRHRAARLYRQQKSAKKLRTRYKRIQDGTLKHQLGRTITRMMTRATARRC